MERFDSLIKQIKDDWIGNDLQYLKHLNIECLDSGSKQIINDYLTMYNVKELELLKEDTGILVLVFDTVVFKIYPMDKYNKIKDLLKINSTNIEKIFNIQKIISILGIELILVINRKIVPFLKLCDGVNKINNELDYLKILNDKKCGKIDNCIFNALSILNKNKYIHGDTTFDNIGVEIDSTGEYNYVLFDFGASQKSIDYDYDYAKYYKSKLKYLYE